jgi:formylglycine-generating enzyme required for sulfatase activity
VIGIIVYSLLCRIVRVIDDDPSCCTARRTDQRPSRPEETVKRQEESPPPAIEVDDRTDWMVYIDSGTFTVGTDEDIEFPQEGEDPPRETTLDPFYIDKYAVTNADFPQFVRQTGYKTDA